MKLYQKLIRPMHSYPGPDYSPRTMPIEKEMKWYPEEERERLEKKYASYNEGSFSDLIFEEKFELYNTKEKSYYGTVKEFIKILEKMQGHKPESINMTQSFYDELKKEIENTWPMVKQAPKRGVEIIMGVKINVVEQ